MTVKWTVDYSGPGTTVNKITLWTAAPVGAIFSSMYVNDTHSVIYINGYELPKNWILA